MKEMTKHFRQKNLKNELRVSRQSSREDRWKGECLVEGVRVKRLRAAENGGHGLHARAHDVVVRILLC